MSYWEDRAALRQAVYDRSSAQTMGIVSDAHKRMLGDLREDARRIIGNFEKAFDLTPAEARKLLKSPLPAKEAERLRERIDLITDPAYKKLMQAKVSSGAYAHRLNRLEGIQMSAETAAIRVADVEKTVGLQHLEETIYQGYGRTMFDVQKYTGIAFQFNGVDERRVKQILRNQWSGKSFSRRVWLNNEEMARQLSRALTERVLQGKTTRETFKALSDLSDMGRMAANRLLSTETNYIANQATAEAYEDAGIERYRYIAVLDGRTSTKCQELSGKEFLLSEKETGVNFPPLHPWCRSSVSPAIPGFVREGMKQWARDPNTGEQMYVPADMTYKEWRESIKPKAEKSVIENKIDKVLSKSTADKLKDEEFMIEKLNPKNVMPVNPITDQKKYQALVYDFENTGYDGRPIVAVDMGDGEYQAITGSHRVYAARTANIEIPTKVVEYNDGVQELLDAKNDEARSEIANRLFKSKKIDKETHRLLSGELDINFENIQDSSKDVIKKKAELYEAQQKQREAVEKMEREAAEKARKAEEEAKKAAIQTSGDMQIYRDYYAEIANKYGESDMWSKMTDSEMDKINNLERLAYKGR